MSNPSHANDLRSLFAARTSDKDTMSIMEYLELCSQDPMAYSTAPQRMLKAIGEAVVVDTSKDPRLSRIFMNSTIRTYPGFADGFFGLEDTIEQIVSYFRHAAQGLEEKKQVLYLMGPVGSAKSSLAERLKELMEVHPIYVLEYEGKVSPIFENPLGLFATNEQREFVASKFKIPLHRLRGIASAWALKRLDEANGDFSKFSVRKMYPSKLRNIGVMKTEPGDENNQDISSLVGKVDIRQLEHFSQNDADAYSFSGGLNRTTQGMLEFVEMFKAPIKVLHPLLTATQEGNYTGTEAISAIPYEGTILAHSNESEWEQFKNNPNNVAFIDRVYIIKAPYCKRLSEEVDIYRKLINSSELSGKPMAPQTLEFLAETILSTRLTPQANSTMYSKIRVYNGEDIRESDPKAKSMHEYKEFAGIDEAMTGLSTRFAYKVLSKAFNKDPEEISADPIRLIMVLEESIKKEQFPKEKEAEVLSYIEAQKGRYADYLGKVIQTAYIESYSEYGQNVFDRYLEKADHWIQNKDYKDPDTGILMNRDSINAELERLEKPAGISNPKDFRHEVVNFCLRFKASNGGKNPVWTSYEKLKEVIERRMFANLDEILPVISFEAKKDGDIQKKHEGFVERMKALGYTERQTRMHTDWFIRLRNA
jgi:serine protein kinase